MSNSELTAPQQKLNELSGGEWLKIPTGNFYRKNEWDVSMTKEEVDLFWDEATSIHIPNSFSYVFDYEGPSFIKDQGFEILGLEVITDELNKNRQIPVKSFLNLLILEQHYLYAYEIRKVINEIFTPFSEYFIEHQSDCFYTCEFTIKDKNNDEWHAHQVITPLCYADLGNGKKVLKSYYGRVQLISKTTDIPFQSMFIDTDSYKDNFNDPIFGVIQRKLNGIKIGISKIYGFDSDMMYGYTLILDNIRNDQIGEHYYYRFDEDSGELEKLNVKSWARDRGIVNTIIKENFKLYCKQFNTQIALQRTKDQIEQKMDKKYELGPKLSDVATSRFLFKTNFILNYQKCYMALEEKIH